MGKRMYLAVGAAVVGGLASVYAFTGNRSAEQELAAWPATKVALAKVVRLDIPRQSLAAGELEAASQVLVAAEAAGRITRIAFESGQVIKAGQLLVQLNDAPEQAQRVQLRAKLHNSETLLQRTRKLRAENVATQEQFESASTAVEVAKGELLQIEALIAQKAIRAPFAGTVGIRRVHLGQHLNAGEAVVSLVDARYLHVNFSLDEQDAPVLRVGQPLALAVNAFAQRQLSAEVTAVDPMISQARQVQVQATLANPDGQLQPGMYASVRLNALRPSSVLAVPETAITYTAYGQTVFIATQDDERGIVVSRTGVTTGERWQGQIEVSSGLKEGDRVVVSGQLKLSDGMHVETVAEDTLQRAVGEHRREVH
ncbi:efflux RND transporter periplasmic adaptor subunit [Pseudomonas sp. DG56-2]|uniref:efflux RND transporter periplasmic adaptor subunit n=1 Tax=Pseudomonas sp. DG56-2 TaxID=2320270 RepID=UPI0010A6764E|nr:efflux RND transporter periplasmic adaptor subunit [Pseudomonas sp. DG56-2]